MTKPEQKNRLIRELKAKKVGILAYYALRSSDPVLDFEDLHQVGQHGMRLIHPLPRDPISRAKPHRLGLSLEATGCRACRTSFKTEKLSSYGKFLHKATFA